MRPPRRSRGYLLVVAFSLMSAMVLIALVIANVGRHTQGLVRLTQSETLQYEAMQRQIATYLGVLSGEPDPSGVLTVDPMCSYRSTDGVIGCSGAALNAFSDGLPSTDYPFNDGQEAQAGWPRDFRLHPQYAALSVVTTLSAQPNITAGRGLALFSRYAPFGLFAANGTVSAGSVRSSSTPLASSHWTDAAPASVYGRTGVTISGALNGSAYACSGPVTIGSGGVAHPDWAAPLAVPESLTSQLAAFKGNVEAGLDGDLDALLADWHQAQHEDFSAHQASALAAETGSCATQGAVLAVPAGPFGDGASTEATHESSVRVDYDTPGGTLTVQGVLRIPNDRRHTLTFQNVEVSKLWLQSGAILHIKGNLSANTVFLGTNATLVVDGTTNVRSSLSFDCTFNEDSNHDLPVRTTLYGKGDVTVAERMARATITWRAASISGRGNPYPSNLDFTCATTSVPPITSPGQIPNPAAADFDVRKVRNESAARRLTDYIGTTVSAENFGGLPMLLLTDGRLSLRAPRCRGFLIAQGDVRLEVADMAGTVWSLGGGIDLTDHDFWFYPRWHLAYPHVAGGTGSMQVGAFLPHQTMWMSQQ